MAFRTHGRWPLVAAAAAGPVTFAARERPALRPLAALLLHQTEEWVWPGEFLPWINREILGSDQDEFPLDPGQAVVINVIFGWGISSAAVAPRRLVAVPLSVLYTTHLGNAVLHLGWAARNRRYDPGSVTAALTLLPVALIGLHELRSDPGVSPRAVRAGVAVGAAMGAMLVPALKLRLRRSRNQASPR